MNFVACTKMTFVSPVPYSPVPVPVPFPFLLSWTVCIPIKRFSKTRTKSVSPSDFFLLPAFRCCWSPVTTNAWAYEERDARREE